MDVISNAIDALVDITPLYMQGFLLTLALLGIAGVGACILGVLIAAMRISPGLRPNEAASAAERPARPLRSNSFKVACARKMTYARA